MNVQKNKLKNERKKDAAEKEKERSMAHEKMLHIMSSRKYVLK